MVLQSVLLTTRDKAAEKEVQLESLRSELEEARRFIDEAESKANSHLARVSELQLQLEQVTKENEAQNLQYAVRAMNPCVLTVDGYPATNR